MEVRASGVRVHLLLTGYTAHPFPSIILAALENPRLSDEHAITTALQSVVEGAPATLEDGPSVSTSINSDFGGLDINCFKQIASSRVLMGAFIEVIERLHHNGDIGNLLSGVHTLRQTLAICLPGNASRGILRSVRAYRCVNGGNQRAP
jgi:hypothetical protein